MKNLLETHIYGHLIYDKGGKDIQWKKGSVFNKWYSKYWTNSYKRRKLEYSLTPYRKTNLKWITDLYVRPDTINFLEENISRTLSDIKSRDIFSGPPPRVMKIKKSKQMVPN